MGVLDEWRWRSCVWWKAARCGALELRRELGGIMEAGAGENGLDGRERRL